MMEDDYSARNLSLFRGSKVFPIRNFYARSSNEKREIFIVKRKLPENPKPSNFLMMFEMFLLSNELFLHLPAIGNCLYNSLQSNLLK